MTTPAWDGRRRADEERPIAPLRDAHAALAACAEPEQRVVRQLVEALLFEKLVAYQSRPRRVGDRYHQIDAIYDRQFEFTLGSYDLRCLGTVGAFDRVRVAQGTVEWIFAAQPRSIGLADIVRSLAVSSAAQERLLRELQQTVTLCRWNRQNLTHEWAPRRSLSFQDLESAIVEGHPYHPCFKTRTGFSIQDHEDYGFEAANTFQLHWLAVVRSSLRVALPVPEAQFWRRELGEREYAVLSYRLAEQGADWTDYALVPVHPWQLRSLCTSGLERVLASGAALSLGRAGDRYQATQSIRTLVNVSHPGKANVKLPLGIICTSTHRNFEKHFICTAPALSAWLGALVAEDSFLQARQRLIVLQEYAGLIYEPEEDALEGRLGAIYRESVCDKLQDGEAAVPFTALTIVESDGRPFIAEWLDEHGVRAWVERIIEVAVIPLWHMLVHHGIAFECHAQNLILVHRNGWPEKIVLRDLHQDTEFVPDYLRAPERAPDFARIEPYFASIPDDDGYRMASTESLRELFMDCVYVFNLADLSFLLARFRGLPEDAFWDAVRAQLRDYERSGVTDKERIDRLAFDSPEIIVESLLTKKLQNGAVLDYFEHRIRNTLHG